MLHKVTTNTKLFCCCAVAKLCSALCDPWTVACQAPLSMGFPRQEYLGILFWGGFQVLLQGIFSSQGLNSCHLHWQVDSLSHGATREAEIVNSKSLLPEETQG